MKKPAQQFDPGRAGLCADCIHAREVESARGSLFVLCALSAADPNYAKYPRLPILRCDGHQSKV